MNNLNNMKQDYSRVNEAKKMLMHQLELERLELLKEAERNGVKVVHVFDPELPKGGLTIAFRKSMPSQVSTNMVECAVVTCSYADNFNRKLGTTLALNAWFDGSTVSLPLSNGYADEDLSGRVKRAFTALFDVASKY